MPVGQPQRQDGTLIKLLRYFTSTETSPITCYPTMYVTGQHTSMYNIKYGTVTRSPSDSWRGEEDQRY